VRACTRVIATIVSTEHTPEEIIKKIDQRANVRIDYTSIYGEPFTYTS